MKSNVSIIIAREYLERVRKKSFIITTILMPLLMMALAVVPTLIMVWGGGEKTKLDVIDLSGSIARELKGSDDLQFVILNDVALETALDDKSADGVLYIPANVETTGTGVKIYSADAVSMPVESDISSQISKIIENKRLKKYNIENLDKILKDVKCDVSIQTIRIDSENGEEEASSSLVSYILGMMLNFFLYMALLLYGQMVMTSIIEEKNNRVLELIVSSVKPTQLMLGKIAGIALVAVTQILIWLVLMVLASGYLLPALIPDSMMAEVSAVSSAGFDQSAASVDVDLLKAIAVLANPMYIFSLFMYLLLFLVGGFLIYAALFAAIGSAVDNIQDASQLQTLVVVPIVLGIVFGMQASTAPNSTLAIVMSIIPFTSPMVMMSRIPFGIPGWQIALSVVILFIGVAAMIWLAAKIYRIGIFMYGKKPTFKELIRWARYK